MSMRKQQQQPHQIGETGNSHVPIKATIDLHGYRKSEAIRSLTDFLDDVSSRRYHDHPRQRQRRRNSTNSPQQQQQQQLESRDKDHVWCLVITGTGAHSPDGRTFCFLMKGYQP
jgi:Smr domain